MIKLGASIFFISSNSDSPPLSLPAIWDKSIFAPAIPMEYPEGPTELISGIALWAKEVLPKLMISTSSGIDAPASFSHARTPSA